jgi:hypothetical protein
VKVKSKMYLHSSRESSVDDFFELCDKYGIEPTDDAIEIASYAGYEVCLDVEWDLDTGDCEIIGVCNGTN